MLWETFIFPYTDKLYFVATQPSHNTLHSALNKSTDFTKEGQACGLLGFLPTWSSSPSFSSCCNIPSFYYKAASKAQWGIFQTEQKGRVRMHEFSWHWWETNGGAGDVSDSGTMKSRVPFFFFLNSPSKWTLNFHKIFETFLQWPLPFPSNFAIPATEARRQRATLSFTKMRLVESYLPSLPTLGKVTL